MFTLGVNTGPHDGSAALLLDGTLLVMAEQERLSRRKHAFGESPADAIAACLATAGITLGDVDEVAVGWDAPLLTTTEGHRFEAKQFRDWLFPPALFGQPAKPGAGPAAKPGAGPAARPKLRFVPHHLAHAASALWTSGADRAAILVIDGRGETQATTIASGTQEGITILREWDTLQSIGHFYGFAAEWAGLSVWDAGKLMGLAAYGNPTQSVPLTRAGDGYEIAGHPEPDDRVPMHYFQLRSHLRRCFGADNYPYSPGVPEEPMAHADFAASVQQALEDVVFRLAETAMDLASSRHLVLAGGVGLNCTMNGRLAESGLFDDYYVPPVPHDAGVSLGAALLASREHVKGSERLGHAFWGPAHPEREITDALREAGLAGTRLTERELVSRVAERLAEGRLVGWWQGRSEVGQRALGARSILCDPRYRHNLVRLNTLKGREVWRPLAPSVLEEYVPDLFGHKLPPVADFMLSAWPVRPEAWPLIPAAVHVDGSARPQVVRQEVSPRYWAVIDAFRQRTGVPAVINTSFNLAGEPNVFTAQDAVSTFGRGGLDVLAIGDYLVENPKTARVGPAGPRSRLGPVITFTPWQASRTQTS